MIDRMQTRLWADARVELGLSADGPDFGRTALSRHLSQVGVVVSVLPADPRRNDLDFGTELFALLPDRFSGITSNVVSSLFTTRLSASAITRLSTGSDGDVRAYVAIRRDAGVEAAMSGANTYYSNDTAPRIYRLPVLIHLVRQVIETQTRVVARHDINVPDGPFQLIMVLPGGAAAVLSGFAPGWQDITHLYNEDIPRADAASDPVVLLDIEEWPTEPAAVVALIDRFASRVSDAFNDPSRRFRLAPGQGNSEGIDPNYA